MSVECVKCHVVITRLDDSIECCLCKKNLHFFCAGFVESNFKKMSRNTKLRFSCSDCSPGTVTKVTKMSTIDDSNSKMLDGKLQDIIKSVNFMGNQFDQFNKKIDSVLKEIKDLKAENEKITAENKKLKDEVDALKYKIDDIKQCNIGHSIEIKGIPKTTNENCFDIVESISKKVNSDIIVKSAIRLGTFGTNSGIIIAELNSSEMKKDFLRKVKLSNLTASMIIQSWSSQQKIYVNERLTKHRRILFSKARTISKEKQYKYIWVNNADILIKKDDGSKIIRIQHEHDLDKL